MSDLEAKVKALELDPNKEYFLIAQDVTQYDMANIPKDPIKFGLIVRDINNVQLHELEELQAMIEDQRMKEKQI